MIQLNITSNYTKALALEIGYDPSPIDIKHGTICAGFILVFLNILIISEVSCQQELSLALLLS